MKAKDFLNEAIVIAVLPIISYAVSFYYETGFLSYFGISDYYVTTSLDSFFRVFLILIFFIISLIFVIDQLLRILPKAVKSNLPIFRPLLLGVVSIFVLIFLQVEGMIIVTAFAMLSLFAFLDYAVPFFTQKGTTYIEKLEKDFCSENQYIPVGGIIENNLKKIGYTNFVILFFLLLALPQISQALGRKHAKAQKEFEVIQYSTDTFAVARKYGENLILVKLNSDKTGFEEEFKLISMGRTDLTLQKMKLKSKGMNTPLSPS